MKKFLSMTFALAAFIFIFGGCKQDVEPDHVHTYETTWSSNETQHWHAANCEHTDEKSDVADHTWNNGVETKAQTCVATGVKTYTCSVCSKTKTETISATGIHTWDNENYTSDNNATTEADGTKSRTCTVCGYKDTVTDAGSKIHVHTYATAWTSDAIQHWHVATCEHTDEVSEKANHTFGEYTSDNNATTEVDGTKSRTCTICGYKDTVTDAGSKIHVHAFATAWTSDTTQHWHAATCAHTSEKSAVANHTWNNGEITTPATEETEGVKTYTCTVCGKTKTESVAKLQHSHKYAQAWTSDDTQHWHVCSGCTEKGSLVNHTWNDGEITTNPTCGAAGVKTYTCTVCGKTRTEPVEKLAHTFEAGWSNNSTQHWHAANCGHTDEKSDLANHIWNDGEITTNPTCGAAGVKTYTCTVCGKTKPEPVEKLAHTFETGWTKSATQHWHAASCGHTSEKSGTADHTWDYENYKSDNNATKLADGTKTRTCTVCGYKDTVTDEGSKIVLTTINVTTLPAKIFYRQGSEFDSTGLEVIAVYSNGTKQTVTDYTYSGFDSSEEAKIIEMTVSYTEEGITKTATFKVYIQKTMSFKTSADIVNSDTVEITCYPGVPGKTVDDENKTINYFGIYVEELPEWIFSNSNCIKTADLGGWDVSGLTNFEALFSNCSSLQSISLSGWDTSNVTGMEGMFMNCSNLSYVYLSWFNTTNVTNMRSMFSYCESLHDLDLTSFTVTESTNVDFMFYRCGNNISSFDEDGNEIEPWSLSVYYNPETWAESKRPNDSNSNLGAYNIEFIEGYW